MSFWPFGQNANSASNLNKLLEFYYTKRQLDSSSSTLTNNDLLSSTNSSIKQGNTSNDQIDQSQSAFPDIKLDRLFVYELLDDSSILNELNRQNNRLIDFICFGYINETSADDDGDLDIVNSARQNSTTSSINHANSISILEILIDLIIDSVDWFDKNEKILLSTNTEQDDDQDDEISLQFHRIHIASEILSCNIWLISETLVEEQYLLSKLWKFLSLDFKSSSPTIQYFVKINEQLLESRPDQLLNFIRGQKNLVDLFIEHIDITIVMDFLLRVITTDKPDIPTGIIELLSEQDLIFKLLDLLDSKKDSSVQSSCGDFLKALISISANTSIDENTIGPNLLTKELVSEDCIDKVIDIILKRGNGLSTVVGVIIELIRKNNSDYDSVNLLYTTVESNPPNKRDPIYLGGMLRKFSIRLNDFNSILFDVSLTSKRIQNQINQSIEPLGFERFKLCELIAELLHCSNIGSLNNHLTEKIIEERESFLTNQESNLANALNEEITNKPHSNALNISSLNIGGASEPSVAISSKNITISPQLTSISSKKGELPILESSDDDINDDDEKENDTNELDDIVNNTKASTRQEQLRKNPTVGDLFKIQLIDSNILKSVITMFTKFPWNNFWHNVVFDIVQQIFNGRLDVGYNCFLVLELFKNCDITNLIINSYNLCVETEHESNVRLGYMGHLVLIAEEVVKFSSIFQNQKFNDTEADELIYGKLIDDDWVNYVTNILTETREQYNCVLGGIRSEDQIQQSDYLNPNAIILGNSEEEILNQPVEGADLDGTFDDGSDDGSDDQREETETETEEEDDKDKEMD